MKQDEKRPDKINCLAWFKARLAYLNTIPSEVLSYAKVQQQAAEIRTIIRGIEVDSRQEEEFVNDSKTSIFPYNFYFDYIYNHE